MNSVDYMNELIKTVEFGLVIFIMITPDLAKGYLILVTIQKILRAL